MTHTCTYGEWGEWGDWEEYEEDGITYRVRVRFRYCTVCGDTDVGTETE
jgi:hypothetical protein